MFIVTTSNPKCNTQFWLTGTTWAFSEDRAQIFNDREEAEGALLKSKKFNQSWAFKRATVVEVATA